MSDQTGDEECDEVVLNTIQQIFLIYPSGPSNKVYRAL